VCTAGEDTLVRIHRLSDDAGAALVLAAVLRGHVSSVKSLCVVSTAGKQKFSTVYLLSAGGRAQLKIWSLSQTQEEEEDDLLVRELDTFMLLGCDKAVRRPWKSTAAGVRPDPETRFLSLATTIDTVGQIWIFVGCSDATLRVFTYCPGTGGKLMLVGELAWQEHCILEVRTLSLGSISCLLVTTTSGRIYGLVEPMAHLTAADEELRPPVTCLPGHQSGINSIDVGHVSRDNNGLILTGGDDNSLQLTEVRLTADRTLRFTPLWRCETAHAAQVTGVRILGKVFIISRTPSDCKQ
jgi:WD40 repeat protein